MACCDRAYDQSWHPTADRTINRGGQRSIARSIVASCDQSYDQSCDYRSAIIHNWWCHHARLVARSRKTTLRPLRICNSKLEDLNMTIDLVTTDFALAITPTSVTSRTFFLRLAHDFNFFWSQVGRNLVVCPV